MTLPTQKKATATATPTPQQCLERLAQAVDCPELLRSMSYIVSQSFLPSFLLDLTRAFSKSNHSSTGSYYTPLEAGIFETLHFLKACVINVQF